MLSVGEKYAGQIKDIIEEWREFPQLYLSDEGISEDVLGDINEIKKDGFYDEELEKMLIGEVSKRPLSPMGKYEANEERLKHQQTIYN